MNRALERYLEERMKAGLPVDMSWYDQVVRINIIKRARRR